MNNISFTDQFEIWLSPLSQWVGNYSLVKHLLLCLIVAIVFHAMLILAMRVRGISGATEKACTRDLLIAAFCALSLILAPIAAFLLARLIYRATIAPGSSQPSHE